MAFGADRSVKVELKAVVSDYLGKITAASKATKDFGKDAVAAGAKHKASFDKVGNGMAITGAAIAVGVGLAIKSFSDFDKEMSNVRAVSGATAGEMGKLRTAALQAGADTKYSASEAAKAESELAKVGISTADILGGALTGSLNLAAAGGLDLAEAATISGQAMKIFGLAGSDVGHIADVLASGANKSAADVSTLGQALQQGGLVAAQTGLTLEDTVGTLSAFADNALNGSDAGTSLKTMLQRLNPQSDEAAALMKDLGLSAYDAQGKFVGITAYAGQLQAGLKNLSAEQRNSTLATIFGSDAVRAANILYKEGAAGIGSYIQGVNDQGAAARVAAIQMDNLAGDVEQLKGSIETGLIQAGSGANNMLRDLVQFATAAANAFGDLPAPLQQGALGLAALSAAGLLTGAAILKVVPQISATKTAMADLGVTAPRVAAGLRAVTATLGGPWGIALVAAAAVVGSFISKQMEAKAQADELRGSLDQQTGAITGNTKAIVARNLQTSGAFKMAQELGVSLKTVTDAAMGQGDALAFLQAKQEQSNTATTAAANAQIQAGDGLGALSGQTDVFATSTEKATAASQGQAAGFKNLLDIVSPINGVLSGQSAKQKEIAQATGETAGGVASLAETETNLAKAAKDAAQAHDDLKKSIEGFGSVVLDARGATRDYEASLDAATAALKENGKTLASSTAKGRANQEALEGIATSALKAATANFENGRSLKSVTGDVSKARTQFLDFAGKMGMNRKAAETLANQLGLTTANVQRLGSETNKLPATKNTKIGTPGAKESTTSVNNLRERIAALQGKLVKVLAEGAGDSAARVAQLRAEIAALQGKTVTITTVSRRVAGTDSGDVIGHGSRHATGGYIAGPGSGTSDSIPAWLSNGEYVINAKATAKYLPLLHAINAKKFATGGPVGFAAGGEVDFQGIMAIIQAGAFSLDDLRAARAKPGQARADVKKAQDALTKLLAAQAKNRRDLHAAQQRLTTLLHTKGASKTSITSARNRVSDELAEQTKLLGQVASAEGKVTSARNGVTTATRAATAAAQAYAKANRPLITRTIDAAGKRNGVTAKFLADIRTLMKRGFTSLARNLMNMGGPEAETLAAQAVKSTKDATSLQSKLDASAKLDSDAQKLEDQLNGVNQPPPKPVVTLKPGESITAGGQKFTAAADRRYAPMPQPASYGTPPSSVTNTSTVFNAHGPDAGTALAKALRDWEFKQVTRL